MSQNRSLQQFAQRLHTRVFAQASAPTTTAPQSGVGGPTDRPGVAYGPDSFAEVFEKQDLEFNALALELFELQFAQNPHYRRFCQGRGLTPGCLAHWTGIPAVPAAAFKELDLSCIPEAQRTKVFFSSGTTGHTPSRHFHHQDSLQIYEASLVAWFAAHFCGGATAGSVPNDSLQKITGYRFRGDLLALTPTPEQATNSSLVHMFDTLRRWLGCGEFRFSGSARPDGAWILDCAKAVDTLRSAIEANRQVMLLGTAFSYVHLLDYMAEHELELHLPPGSQALETGGYKGRCRALTKAELHTLMTQRLGVESPQIVCEYGMSELSSQAYDGASTLLRQLGARANNEANSNPRPFHFPPWTRIQILSPETGGEVLDGQIGLLRVFDLANVYSVMALQTEDLARRSGDGFELIGRAAAVEARGCSLMLDR